jgi:apolipoprotein N-acyltransferase
MAFAPDPRRLGLGLAAVLLTALLAWFGTGLDPSWPLLWFAPLPVLLFAWRASWWGAFLGAFLGWWLGCFNLWGYFHQVARIPPPIALAIFAAEALIFAVAVLLYRALVRRGAYWSGLVAFPALWVSFEYLLNITSPHGTGGNLAYTQLDFLPFLQLASLTGPWGMSFLLLLFPAALAIGLQLRSLAAKQAAGIVGASLGAIAVVLVFGALRLALPSSGRLVKVGLLASDLPGNVDVADEGADTQRLLQAYAAPAAVLAARGAQVVVLPEKLGVAVDRANRDTDALFQSLADRTNADIVVGLIHVSSALKYNQARLYAPAAATVSTYDKHHLLPPLESWLEAGTTQLVLHRPSGSWGVAICKDMDFTPLSRRYGAAGVGLMLVPAWDFVTDRWAHGHMAIMRGVESGFAVARSAKQGYLTVSDNRGRVLAETASDSAPFASLVTDVPAAHAPTLYLLLGDWFASVALAALAFATVQLWRTRVATSGPREELAA